MALYDEILADSPAAYWRLQDSSGIVAADASGNAVAGSYLPNSGGAWTGGTLGTGGGVAGTGSLCAKFNGTTNYAEALLATDPTALTMEGWVQFAAYPASGGFHALLSRSAASTAYHVLRINASGLAEFVVTDTAARTVTGSTALQPNRWYHLAGTAANSGQARLYVNGAEEGTAASVGTMSVTPDRWRIGRSGSSYLGGYAAEVAVYHAALSAARLAAHYAAAEIQIAPNARLTQAALEALQTATPTSRLTQLNAEVLQGMPTNARLTQVYLEILRPASDVVRRPGFFALLPI